jgi:hypothetical protein
MSVQSDWSEHLQRERREEREGWKEGEGEEKRVF